MTTHDLIVSWCNACEYEVDLDGTSLPDEFSESLCLLHKHPLLSFMELKTESEFIEYVRDLFEHPHGSLVLYWWKDAMVLPLMCVQRDDLDTVRYKLNGFSCFLRNMASASACLHPPIGSNQGINTQLHNDPATRATRTAYGLYYKDSIEEEFQKLNRSFEDIHDDVLKLINRHLHIVSFQ
jgi:hypothetical protein